jgi:hypothetical protein
MRRSKTARIVVVVASVCLLFALGCGLLGLAVQQGMVTPKNITVQLGPLIFITRGPRSFACLQNGDPLANLCDRVSSAPRTSVYRVWLFWYMPGRGTESTRILSAFTLPLNPDSRGQDGPTRAR